MHFYFYLMGFRKQFGNSEQKFINLPKFLFHPIIRELKSA